jgi:hypothetical protein
VDSNDRIDEDAYDALYARRLLPGFQWIEEQAQECGQPALVIVPGLGCGQFAGPFQGQLGAHLERALRGFLDQHSAEFPHIQTVIFGTYDECRPNRAVYGGIDFRVSRLTRGGKPHLSQPAAHAIDDEDRERLKDCRLFSFVAWDHVSWPGNDFYGGARATDDGVKAAATNAMEVITGVSGRYDSQRNEYLPPEPHRTWGELVRTLGICFP